MLVLSRKNGQKIIINDNIVLTIVESRFDSCKISIDAPRDVKIYREEVYQQIQFANKMSNRTSTNALDDITKLIDPSVDTTQKVENKVIIKKKII